MDQSVAVKKLRKVLGKGFGYRVNPKAGLKEDREKARNDLKAANAERERLRAEAETRRQEILADDQEYQTKLKAFQDARARAEKLLSLCHSYRVRVGTVSGESGFRFFSVKAEGDNWQEVVEKVTAK